MKVPCKKSDAVEEPGREVQILRPTKISIIEAEESHSILLSKGWNMVAVTYNHLNGCKCHNRACSWGERWPCLS